MAPWDINQDYADEAFRKALECGLPFNQQLLWLEERDLLTRGKMVIYMRQQWPQGEALKQAWSDAAVQWAMASQKQPVASQSQSNSRKRDSQAMAQQPQQSLRSSSPKAAKSPKKSRHARVTSKNEPICKKYNDQRSCTKDDRQCPERAKHVCDVVKGNGQVCGAWNHNRLSCPHNK